MTSYNDDEFNSPEEWATPNQVTYARGGVAPPPSLQVGADDSSALDPEYRPEVEMHRRLEACEYLDRKGDKKLSPPTQRLAEMFSAWFWPVSYRGTVWLTTRQGWEPPEGGILRPLGDTETITRAQARFARKYPREPIPSKAAIETALGAFAGTAAELDTKPWLRWGRSPEGSLWWDSGRKDGRAVRVTADGWTIEPRAGCWFVRTELTVPMPLPAQGSGDLEAIWDHVRISEQDRGVVIGWMLAASQPERSRAAGILYLSGPSGAGKSCAADIIARAGGAPADRKQFGANKMDGRDFLVGASAGWVTYLDNLSMVSAEQSDTLCCLVTGLTETYRTMRTNIDTTSIDISRPVIATSVEIPVLRTDLITRMAPVQLDLPHTSRPEDDVMTEAAAAQPLIFAGYLDLLSKVMGSEHLPIPEDVPLPRLAVMGRMAHAADRHRGTEGTLRRLEHAQGELLNETLTDDPFFATIIREVTTEFVGGGELLLARIDPEGGLASKYGKQWPIGSKGVSHRLKRHVGAFARAGWSVKSIAATHRQPTQWIITPPSRPARPTERVLEHGEPPF